MWKKGVLVICILGNVFSMFLIGIYLLLNSWFFHAELGSVAGVEPDYLIQLNNQGILYDYRQMIEIASNIKAYKLFDTLEIGSSHIYRSSHNYQILIGEIDRDNKQYIIYDGYLDHYIFVNLKFDMDEKRYNDFFGRVKVIDGYDKVPVRYRKLIENGEWQHL